MQIPPNIGLSPRERLSGEEAELQGFRFFLARPSRTRLGSHMLELDSRFSSSFFSSVTDKPELLPRVARNYGNGNSGLSIAA